MKKVILLLIVICITRFSSIAQLSYGVKAGINRELSKINKQDVVGGTLHNTVMALSIAYTFKK